MAKKPRKSRFADEASINAAIKYGPQSQALNELLQQAMEGRDSAIQAAKGTSAGAIAQIDQAAPQVARLYDRAQAEQQQRASVLAPDLAGLGGVANSIRAAALTEQSQGATDLGENRVGALTDLLNRRVQAKSGAMFATKNAQQQFIGDLAKVQSRKLALAGEQGAFTVSELARLSREAQSQANEEARIDISAGSAAETRRHNRVQESAAADKTSSKRAPSASSPGSGEGNRRTPLQHGSVKDQIGSLQGWIQQNKRDYRSRSEMARDLLNGVPASTVKNDAKGNPLKNPVKIPAVPKAPSQLALSVALDLAYDGHLSRRNAQELHKRGYSVKDLGLTTYSQWKKRAVPQIKPKNPFTTPVRS